MSINNINKLIHEIINSNLDEYKFLSSNKDILKNIQDLDKLRKERNEKINEQLKLINDEYDEKIDKCEKAIIAKIKIRGSK